MPGADMAVLNDIPVHSGLHNTARAKCQRLRIGAIEWSSLDFCEGCEGPAGCKAFCACIVDHTEQSRSLLDSCTGVRYNGHSTRGTSNDGAWGSLLPISIVIFFGGFLCQMYIKSNSARGAGGGLGGRGENEGAELLCLPARRRKVPEDNERMVRRAASAHPLALSTLPPTVTLTAHVPSCRRCPTPTIRGARMGAACRCKTRTPTVAATRTTVCCDQ